MFFIDKPMSASSIPEDGMDKPTTNVAQPSNPPSITSVDDLPYIGKEDIIYRAVDRTLVCRVLSRAHIDVSVQWGKTHLYIGIPSTILAAVASVQAISSLDNKLITVVISVLVAILAPLLTFLDPNAKSASHLEASRVYERMGDQYDAFLLECTVNSRSIEEELNDLVAINTAYSDSKRALPACPEWAYQRALNNQSKQQQLISSELKKSGGYEKFMKN